MKSSKKSSVKSRPFNPGVIAAAISLLLTSLVLLGSLALAEPSPAEASQRQAPAEPEPPVALQPQTEVPTILQTPPARLHLVSPARSALAKPVDVVFKLDGDVLRAHFNVNTKAIFDREHLAPGEYPYQFDVVELFISVAGQASPFPYYEFEVSPHAETFQVKIPGGKKPFQEGIDLGLVASTNREHGAWTADLAIPLKALGYDGDPTKLVGNAYAIVGQKPNRSFWSLSLPPQAKPNFHMPQFFPTAVSAGALSATGWYHWRSRDWLVSLALSRRRYVYVSPLPGTNGLRTVGSVKNPIRKPL